jgi:hypothetical protein
MVFRLHHQLIIMNPSMVTEVENGFFLVGIISTHTHGGKPQNRGKSSRLILCPTNIVVFHFIFYMGGSQLEKLGVDCISIGVLKVGVLTHMES